MFKDNIQIMKIKVAKTEDAIIEYSEKYVALDEKYTKLESIVDINIKRIKELEELSN